MRATITKSEFLTIIIIIFLFIFSWIPSKSIGTLAWIELIFILCSIVPILFLGTEKGLGFVKEIMGYKYIGLKFFLITFFVLWGYLVATKFPLPTIPQEINYRALGGFLQTVTLRYLPISIFFLIAPPFLILSYNNRQIQQLEVSHRDIWTLIILYTFSYFQMSWIGTSLQTFLHYNPLFYLHFIFTIWFFVTLPLVLFLVQRSFPRELIGFSLRVRWKDIKYFLFAAPFCILLFLFFPSPFRPISLNQPTLFLLNFVYKVFAIALPCELLFRGLFIGIIAEKLNNSKMFSKKRAITLAVIISSVLYALTHYWNGIGAIGGQFLIGIFFGIIFVRTKSLIAPILIHTLLAFVGRSAPIALI